MLCGPVQCEEPRRIRRSLQNPGHNVECVRTVKADLKGEKKDFQVLIKKSGELKTPFQKQKSDLKGWVFVGFFSRWEVNCMKWF